MNGTGRQLRPSGRVRSPGGRVSLAPVVLALAIPAGLTACAGAPKPIFEEIRPPIEWPGAPAPPRIRYVGELRTSADLKPVRKASETLRAIFAGRKPSDPLYGPRSVVCTRDGQRAWVADPGGRCLHLFDLEQRAYKRITRFGSTLLLSPVGVCLGPDDSIFVCDSEAAAIYRLSARDGRLETTLRLPEELLRPVAARYDEKADELYVADVVAHNIKVLGGDGALHRIIGRRGSGPGQLNYPCDLELDGERLWVADTGNHRVQALSRSGDSLLTFGQAGDAPGDLAMPKSLGVDLSGHVYVVDGRFENVQIFSRAGELLLFFGEEGTGPGEFWLPGGLFIEPGGRIWVCDSYNRRVQVFQYVEGTAKVAGEQ